MLEEANARAENKMSVIEVKQEEPRISFISTVHKLTYSDTKPKKALIDGITTENLEMLDKGSNKKP